MRWTLLLSAYGSLLVYGLVDNARGPLFPDLLLGLRLSDSLGGLLFTTTSGFGAVGAVGGRWVRRRVSLSASLRLGLLLFALGAAGFGASRGLPGLLSAAAVLGVGMGLLSLVQAEAVARGSPPALHRRTFAGLHVMYGASSFAAPLVVGALARAELGWQATCFVLSALVCLSVLVLLPVSDPGGPAPEAPKPEPGAKSEAPDDAGLGRQVLFSMILGTYCMGELTIGTRLVLHARRLDWSPGEAEALLSGFFLGMLAGRMFVTLVPLRLSHRGLLYASGGLAALSAVAGLLWHPAGLAVSGLFMGPFYPTGQALLRESFPRSFDAVMGTALVVVAGLVMATHAGVGVASDAVGLPVALWIVPSSLVAAVILTAVSGRAPAS
jgi:fucose permease